MKTMTDCDQPTSVEIERRRQWMGAFAKANLAQLELGWERLEPKPQYEFIRAPENGQVMVRARAGGVGRRFNLGEITLSRCVVRLEDATLGFGYTSSRSKRHAELAAVFDALLQDPTRRLELEPLLLAPLLQEAAQRQQTEAARTASTRVDFFTLVRGDD